MTLRVLVADDELMARKRLHRLLTAMPDVEWLGECEDGEQVLVRVEDGDVDVLLLDIHMPHLSGVDALGLLGPDGPLVVFTTAHAQYAIDAFNGGAIDYLLKPIDAGRLAKALERSRERLRPIPTPAGRLPIPTRGGVDLIPFDSITHAVIEGESVVLHTTRGQLFTDARLADLERRLPDRFERIHRKVLVDRDRIQRLEAAEDGGYVACLDDGSKLEVSRAAARRLRKLWGL